MIICENLTKRFGHFTAVDRVSCAVARLNEPPEPSPGLSGAMPWVNVPQIIPRPEGAREVLGRSHRGVSSSGYLYQRFFRPIRADGVFAARSQGIARQRDALGCILMALHAIKPSDSATTF